MKPILSEEKLELAISYILIIGVMVSVAIEAIGIFSYYYVNRNLSIIFQPQYCAKGSGLLQLLWSYSAKSDSGKLDSVPNSSSWTRSIDDHTLHESGCVGNLFWSG